MLVGVSALSFGQTNEQWRDSLGVVSRQIEREPNSVALRLHKAAINLQLGQWEYAIEEYDMILQNDPQNMSALFFRAYANNQMRRYALACNDYETILRFHPRSFEARLGLACVLMAQGKNPHALDQMNTLIEQHPDSTTAYVARANLERDMRQYEAALYDYDVALGKNPRDVDLVISKTEVLLRLGRRSEARQTLDKAVARGVAQGVLREWYKRTKK